MKPIQYIRENPLMLLLLAVPLAIIAQFGQWSPLWVFVLSALGVVPLAGLIGEATEVLAEHIGPRLGGLLNATLGNAAELIITIVAIRAGLLELVKASITGSILGNLLLVLGMSMLLGGLKNGTQRFDQRQASNNTILLALVVVTLLVPSLFSSAIGQPGSLKVEALSLGVSVVMIVLYALGIFYSLRVHSSAIAPAVRRFDHNSRQTPAGRTNAQAAKIPRERQPRPKVKENHTKPRSGVEAPSWSVRTALIVLALSTVGVAYLSELLVGAVEPVVANLGVSEFFLGIILIPIVGNVAEHLVAVKVALENQMELSVEIAVASSLQIALFVAPVLVFVSLALGHRLQLVFNEFELVALIAGVLIAAMVAADGESNWLEGVALLAVYVILALGFFLLPV